MDAARLQSQNSCANGGEFRRLSVSATQTIVEPEQASANPLRLLYICDFPPCNCHGGAILMSRLLEDSAGEHLLVITSTPGMRLSKKGDLLDCKHIAFPVLGASGVRWFGRLKHILNWIILAVACCTALASILWRRVDAVITVLHGRFYFAGALAAYLTRTPYVVVVHDDFISIANTVSKFSANILRPLAKRVLQRAAHVYAVSPEMTNFLANEFGVDSELQLPATTKLLRRGVSGCASVVEAPVIVFAGGVTFAVRDSLDLVAKLITGGAAAEYGMPGLKLRLFSELSVEQAKEYRWDHANIEIKGWVPQSELRDALGEADILLLPYSFSENARHAVETAFPSKTADYLASRKPILILAPSSSTLVRYAREEGFADTVDEFSTDALARTIHQIVFSPEHRARLVDRAQQVFCRNHDIANQRSKFFATLCQLASPRH
jgi:glycosyltransferase involved in cell wall biosynthesis